MLPVVTLRGVGTLYPYSVESATGSISIQTILVNWDQKRADVQMIAYWAGFIYKGCAQQETRRSLLLAIRHDRRIRQSSLQIL